MQDGESNGLPLPVAGSPPRLRNGRWEDADPPTKEACAAWERSLRPGQYFSERGGHRPMHHRTQAVQGHPGARAWPRGPDGGAWGPQELSPIPSEKGYMPLVPSPTTSPGRGSRSRGQEFFFPRQRSPAPIPAAFTVADAVAAEVGFEGLEREALRPFEPIALQHEKLPPALQAPPLETPWRAPPPGFDARTLRRQACALRGEAAVAHRHEESVRRSNLKLAEILRATVENGKQNVALAREKLCCLHAALRRLRMERARHGETVKAAVAWQESLEELREKLASSEERRQRAERAKGDVQRTLRVAIDANRKAEAEVVPLERELEAAWRRDEVAAEIERQSQQEELADAFFHRRRRRLEAHRPRSYSRSRRNSYIGHLVCSDTADVSNEAPLPNDLEDIDRGEGAEGNDDEAGVGHLHRFPRVKPSICATSPLLLPTVSWGFQVFAEACRRSKGMRRLAMAREEREEVERRDVLREALAAWAVGAALERGGRDARQRRTVEVACLCLARWRLFAALEQRFRSEQRRRSCKRILDAWRGALREARRDRDLDRRREALLLRQCFRGWRVLRARSILTPQEYLERRSSADRHRLGRLFATWHLAALASSASSKAIVRGVRLRRNVDTLAASFRAWTSLSRARRWRRRRYLRRGLQTLASFSRRAAGVEGWGASTMFSNKRLQPALKGSGAGVQRETMAKGIPSSKELPFSVVNWRGRSPGRRYLLESAAGGISFHKLEAMANSHRRLVGLSKGIRALRQQGSAVRRMGTGWLFCVPGASDQRGVVVSVRAARAMCMTWCAAARARSRARDGMEMARVVHRRKGLEGAVKEWRHFAIAAARQRRADRASLLRRSFVALRQGCAVFRRQRSACSALHNALVRQRLGLLGSAMTKIAAAGSFSLVAAVAIAPAARRRREREALEAAWRCWAGGWLRRQAETIRMRELESQRRTKRDRDLAEQLVQVQQESTALQKEAASAETELQRTKVLVLEQEEALDASRRSLAEASAAAAAVKSRLGHAARFDTSNNTNTATNNKAIHSSRKARTTSEGRKQARGDAAAAPTKSGDGSSGSAHVGVAMAEDRGLHTRRLARRRSVTNVLVSAEGRRKAAARVAAVRERAAAEVRGQLLGQEEADRVALEAALEEVRRYADRIERGQAQVKAAEAERLRVQGSTAELLERVEQLSRKAEEEATQGARKASTAESERAALSLGLSTAEARAREMMVILDERGREAAELRRVLAGKDSERQAKRLLRCRATSVEPTTVSPPPREGSTPLSRSGVAASASATAADPMGGWDVQELKESIAWLQKKVVLSRIGNLVAAYPLPAQRPNPRRNGLHWRTTSLADL